ncbi:hypothetical protein BK127_30765 [Paenibacillus sp. FSL H7-0331]|nr:hypothetical protein BK127_30765 [Paenibacillus sp. FSL H7-0331]
MHQNHIFDVIVTQEDNLLHKPHSAPLILAARLLYSPPENCIYILHKVAMDRIIKRRFSLGVTTNK